MNASQQYIGMPVRQIAGCYFSVLSEPEITKLSVMHVTSTTVFDSLGHSVQGGLYDMRMGPLEHGALCGTCGQNSFQCAGHMGHIELPVPVYNPLLYMDLIKLIRGICVNCHKLAMEQSQQDLFVLKMKLLDVGNLYKFNEVTMAAQVENNDVDRSNYVHSVNQQFFRNNDIIEVVPDDLRNRNLIEARDQCVKGFISEFLNGKLAKCSHCSFPMICYKNDRNTQIIYRRRIRGAKYGTGSGEQTEDHQAMFPDLEGFMAVTKVQSLVQGAWKLGEGVFCYVYGRPGRHKPFPDMFFITTLPVIPPRFRPYALMNSMRVESPQTASYNQVLKIRQGLVALQSSQKRKDKD
jgi:DNA-directed RNA polymerase I subunit RPA1